MIDSGGLRRPDPLNGARGRNLLKNGDSYPAVSLLEFEPFSPTQQVDLAPGEDSRGKTIGASD